MVERIDNSTSVYPIFSFVVKVVGQLLPGEVAIDHTMEQDVLLGGLVVAADDPRGINNQAAGATGGVEDRAVVRLDHLDDELHDGRWSEVLAALLHKGGCE